MELDLKIFNPANIYVKQMSKDKEHKLGCIINRSRLILVQLNLFQKHLFLHHDKKLFIEL